MSSEVSDADASISHPDDQDSDSTEQAKATTHTIQFHGNAGDYFRIWIVNIALTLLTVGIYSAWAKVRTHKYFYGNTRLDDAAFEYTGEPLSILKGRAIALAALVIYSIATNARPELSIVFVILFLLLFPWVAITALRFRARNTVYRNIRFHFKKDYREAFATFTLTPILFPLTFGLIFPYFEYRKNRFTVNNFHFGTTPFNFESGPGSFYGIYLSVLMILVLGGIVTFAVTAIIGVILPQIAPFVMVIFYLWAYAFVRVQITNLVFNSMTIRNTRFKSTLKTNELFVIYLTNALAIIFTLGLAIPWSLIRVAKYRADNLSVITTDSLDDFEGRDARNEKATGEEMSEAFDVDIGL